MTDSHIQPNGHASELAASDLDRRLRRRATEPLGVIDVTYAQRKCLRLFQWLAGRTSLVDRLRTVYGVEEALNAGGRPLSLQYPLGQQVDVFSTTIRSFSSAADTPDEGPDAREHDVAWDAQSSDEPEHNVASEAQSSSLGEIIAERPTKPAGEREAPPEGSFRVSRRPPATLAGSVAELFVHSPRATPRFQAPAPEAISLSQQSHPYPDSPDTNSVAAPQQPRDVITNAAPGTNQGRSDLVFKKNAVESSVAKVAVRSTSAQDEHAAVAVTNARGGAPSSVDRQSNDVVASAQSTSKSQAAPLPHMKPLIGDSFSMPEMVWRKQRVNSQAPDFTVPAIGISEPANATQSRQSEFAYRGSESRRIGAQALMGSDEVRAEHISPRVIRNIAERVVRAISLDLKLERERRGVTKWR
jgi:hypothetical protein